MKKFILFAAITLVLLFTAACGRLGDNQPPLPAEAFYWPYTTTYTVRHTGYGPVRIPPILQTAYTRCFSPGLVFDIPPDMHDFPICLSLAAQLFAAMLGGTPFSKLFMNVREKLSLCYYCAARYDISNKLLLIDSGVEPKNKQTAQGEILRQLDAIRSGDFTADELANTKLFLINSIKSVNDSQSALASWYLTRTLRGIGGTPADDCEAIAGIEAAALCNIANNVTLDTVYHLAGKEVACVES